MNKKANTIFFILGATLFNVIVAIVSFILLLLLYSRFFTGQGQEWVLLFIFIASLAISFIAYRYALKYLMNKIDVDKYFDPLFVRRNIKRD